MPQAEEFSGLFKDALIAGDLDTIRRCPKADLQNHGVMGGDPASVLPDDGLPSGPLTERLASMQDMHAWVQARFGKTGSDPSGRLRLIEAAFAQADSDGVTRVEIGDDAWATTLFGGARKLTDGLIQAHARGAPQVEWIPAIGISRHCEVGAIERWLGPLLGLGYQTLDLSGDELVQPIGTFKPLYQKAKTAGLRLKTHVGEWGTADDVWRAVEELELDEVQHGIAAAESPTVMRFLADHQIRLNICPTSNLMLGRVVSLAHHPIRALFDAGIPVTINTDDMLVFGQSVSAEFLNVYRAGCLNETELDQIRCNGLTDD